MDDNSLKPIVEALLFSAEEPLSFEKIQSVFGEGQRPGLKQLIDVIDTLNRDYTDRAFEIKQLASGYIVNIKKEYSPWIARIQSEKPVKYSRALLETLAIIAYKQPVSRGDIEEIRGVAVNSQIMKTLMEREWIKVAGHKDVPGKPAVYATTKEFLNYFNLQHLNELPSLPEVFESLAVHHVEKSIDECVIQ